MVSLFLNTV